MKYRYATVPIKLRYFGLIKRLLFINLFWTQIRIRIRIQIRNVYFRSRSGSEQKFPILTEPDSDPVGRSRIFTLFLKSRHSLLVQLQVYKNGVRLNQLYPPERKAVIKNASKPIRIHSTFQFLYINQVFSLS